MMRHLALFVVLLGAAACQKGGTVAGVSCSEPGWSSATTPDSSAVFCIAPGDRTVRPAVGGARWVHGAPNHPHYAYFTIAVLDSAAAALEWGTPPQPKPLGGRRVSQLADAVVAESIVTRREQIDGRYVDVETALISGGAVGFRRRPALRAVWPISEGRWVLAEGLASAQPDLEIQRAMLRTLRVSGRR